MIAHLHVGALVSLAACGASHGASDGGEGGAVADAALVDGDPTVDARVGPDAPPDATTPVELSVTVWADWDGEESLADAPWRLTGRDGFVLEGRTPADGHVELTLPRDVAPYEWTVAGHNLGARSLVAISDTMQAEVHLAPPPRFDPPPTPGPETAFEVAGVEGTDRASISGPGIYDVRYDTASTGGVVFNDTAPSFAVVAVQFERATVFLPEWEFEMPVLGGSIPVRARLAFGPSSTPPSSTLYIDLGDGVVPTAHPFEIQLPTGGVYVPDALYVEALAFTWEPGGRSSGFVVPVGSITLTRVGSRFVGQLYFFDPPIRPDEVQLELIDGGGRLLGKIILDASAPARVVIPDLESRGAITGSTFDSVSFTAGAPSWSETRYGVGQSSGDRSVQWIAVASFRRLEDARLPELPTTLTIEDLGFERTAGLSAFLESSHAVDAAEPISDAATVPYVSGYGVHAAGVARLRQDLTWE